MNVVPLVAVAHGSRDPRSAAAIHALMDEVRRQRPDLDVRTAFSIPFEDQKMEPLAGSGIRG